MITMGMTMRALGLTLLGYVSVGACDRRAAAPVVPSTAPTQDVTAPPFASEPAFIQASGRGASSEEARTAAQRALAEALLGDAAWLDIVPIEMDGAVTEASAPKQLPDGTIEVTLGLSRASTAALLTEFKGTPPRVDGPAVWHDPLYAYLFAHVGAHACERRRELFQVDCDGGDTTEVDDALAQLASGVSLASVYQGGVPLDAEGKPLRSPAVYVHWRGVPANGVEVEAHVPTPEGERVLSAKSDIHGLARFELPLDQPFMAPLRVSLDTRALVGPLHTTWPKTTIALQGRPADLRRWGAAVVEQGGDAPLTAGPLVEGLSATMKAAGMGDPVGLPGDHARKILRAEGRQREDRIRALADALGGRVDIVVLVSATSRFANKMGGARVWYEASGEVTVHDAWSGRVLTRERKSATASGLGNDRADQSARNRLGEAIAEAILENTAIPRPQRNDAVATASTTTRAWP